MNIAEDLKEYAKVKVSPMEETKAQKEALEATQTKGPGSKKPSNIDDMQK